MGEEDWRGQVFGEVDSVVSAADLEKYSDDLVLFGRVSVGLDSDGRDEESIAYTFSYFSPTFGSVTCPLNNI